MIGNRSTLQFPHLIFVKEYDKSESGRYRAIYKLDWTHIENRFRQSYEKRVQQRLSQEVVDPIPTFKNALPDKYMEMTDNLRFLLDTRYKKEINRASRLSMEEWSNAGGFDTMVNDWCVVPATKFVWLAFKLLSDCPFDPNTNKFDRRHERNIASNIMLYRFWFHQTGRGLIWYRAEINKLNDMLLDDDRCRRIGIEQAQVYRDLVVSMKEHENTMSEGKWKMDSEYKTELPEKYKEETSERTDNLKKIRKIRDSVRESNVDVSFSVVPMYCVFIHNGDAYLKSANDKGISLAKDKEFDFGSNFKCMIPKEVYDAKCLMKSDLK